MAFQTWEKQSVDQITTGKHNINVEQKNIWGSQHVERTWVHYNIDSMKMAHTLERIWCKLILSFDLLNHCALLAVRPLSFIPTVFLVRHSLLQKNILNYETKLESDTSMLI